jgi:signal transduction histidine kinase
LADRAAQLGGTLQVGNRNEGGVMLSAEIPLMVTA